MDAETRLKNIRDGQNYFSGKISEQTRYVGLGLAAVAFTLISAESSFYQGLSDNLKSNILHIGAIGCFIVVLDYAQYILGYLGASLMANNESADYLPTPGSKALGAFQNLFFYLKQIVGIFGSLWLLWVLYQALS